MNNGIALFLLLLQSNAVAIAGETAPAPAPPKENFEMAGVRLADYAGFEKTWRMVTVRFRKDTDEMRFTYANEAAWQTLVAGRTDYPDGAVFAKIGVITKADPAFTSSAEPTGARRFQFMVRDRARFASTDGWGYALFDATGRTYPEDLTRQQVACWACHKIVPERGQVFSRIANFAGFQPTAEPSPAKAVKFRRMPVAKLPGRVRALVGKEFREALVVQGELAQSLFQGTLDELKPLLAARSRESKLPAAIVSPDGARFSLVQPTKATLDCPKSSAVVLESIYSSVDPKAPEARLVFCQDP